MNLQDFRKNAYMNMQNLNVNSNDEKNFQNQTISNAQDYSEKNSEFTFFKVPAENQNDSVYRRVAKFLVLIGVDEAAKILPLLSAEQTEKIIPEIATVRKIDDDEAQKILLEFQGLYKTIKQKGGKETAREILQKAYGEQKATEILKKAAPFSDSKPFEYLNDASSQKIKILLDDESEGVKTLVLSNIEPKKAAAVINLLKDEEKTQIVKRLAQLKKINPEVLARVDKAMKEKSLTILSDDDKGEKLDGRNALAEILKQMDSTAENSLLQTISKDDPELAGDLSARLFTLQDVQNADNRFISEMLRTYSNQEIIELIAAKDEKFVEKIFSCISSGRREEIKVDMEIKTPLLKSDCEKTTNKFVSKLRNAYNEGKLIIKGRNDDIYV